MKKFVQGASVVNEKTSIFGKSAGTRDAYKFVSKQAKKGQNIGIFKDFQERESVRPPSSLKKVRL